MIEVEGSLGCVRLSESGVIDVKSRGIILARERLGATAGMERPVT